ncbi:MAG TPA: MaoC family dehydratase [Acidimicrobiales bacterium]|nr:MaoC family dehydratase [Acidimicrobiales bacterium]
MAITVFADLDALQAGVGKHLGYSDWLEITPARVDDFALATGAGAETEPYLALSLSNYFLPQIVEVRGISMGINYGANQIRFPSSAAARAGSRVRAGAELVAADPVAGGVAGGVQAQIRITVEIEGCEQPACVIESLSRYLA